MIAHHFTVDVEEYFQVSALEPYVERASWDSIPSRLRAGMDRILRLLDDEGVTATFFILGWIAERHRGMVREIAAAGHEIASHGWGHRRVTELSPTEFRGSVRRSKQLLEEICGVAVHGYRAPSFSIVPERAWALDVLVEEGYLYDSSLFPIRREGYGWPGGERDIHALERASGRLLEVPPVTLRIRSANVPAAGGGYFRLLPYTLTRAALRSAERRGVPGTFYIHPWEVDPEQPRLPVPVATRVRHYAGLGRTFGRLKRLLGEFRFQPIARTLGLEKASCPPQ